MWWDPYYLALTPALAPPSAIHSHLEEAADRAAVNYALHHLRNPLHKLTGTLLMLKCELPSDARRIASVRETFRDVGNILEEMRCVLDYTLVRA